MFCTTHMHRRHHHLHHHHTRGVIIIKGTDHVCYGVGLCFRHITTALPVKLSITVRVSVQWMCSVGQLALCSAVVEKQSDDHALLSVVRR
jgi:hypothetical protein